MHRLCASEENHNKSNEKKLLKEKTLEIWNVRFMIATFNYYYYLYFLIEQLSIIIIHRKELRIHLMIIQEKKFHRLRKSLYIYITLLLMVRMST